MKKKTSRAVSVILFFICWPLGVFKIWKNRSGTALGRLVYTIIGLPVFLLTYSFFSIIIFSAFLPELDRTIGIRNDRTIYNSTDHYKVTFLKTARETGGAYEEVKVDLEPNGGNEWHYHTAFVEKFHVIEGELTVGMEGRPVPVFAGQDTIVKKGLMHKFSNTSTAPVSFIVKIEPARSFEKTIRAAYGLMNAGQSSADGIPKNPWHLFLILGYSDSYLQGVPGIIQEPLIRALSKIAQWKGADKDLEPFCR